jgi:hypothetical protein
MRCAGREHRERALAVNIVNTISKLLAISIKVPLGLENFRMVRLDEFLGRISRQLDAVHPTILEYEPKTLSLGTWAWYACELLLCVSDTIM